MIHNEIVRIADKYFCKHWSDAFMIRQVETDRVFVEAYDTTPCRFTYEETDEPLPEPEPAEVVE